MSSSEAALKAESGGGEPSEVAMIGTDQPILNVNKGIVKKAKKERLGCTAKERISKMPPCAAGKRSSIYRGVTRHRWTGRYEAHLWDKSTWNQNQNKKGKQVYLGAYDDEEAAARAYDLAALKYWGSGTLINFPVSDYTRDLEEMQNVSREDYLASLRRKSSGFSRGIAKYRGLSSRWDTSGGRIPGPNYFNSIYYVDPVEGTGEDAAAESEHASGFCIDRKIDLTPYIKWWGSSRTRTSDSLSKCTEETKTGNSDDLESELKPLERAIRATEPYQMPSFGIIHEGGKKETKLSAMSILSQSAAFKSLQDKALKKQEKQHENDENEKKIAVNKIECGKEVEKINEGLGVTLGGTGALHLQRSMYPLGSLLSAPLLTNYNTIDHLGDPIIWSTLAPVLPPGLSHTAEVTKTESSSNYTFFQHKE